MSPSWAEQKRLEVQEILDAERTPALRNRAGQYATPPALAEQIARAAIGHLDMGDRRHASGRIHLLDPSLGTGALISAALRGVPATRIGSARGVELDPRFARAATDLWGRYGLQVVQGDFTRLRPQRRANLLLANPPYTRHHHLAPAEKERLRTLVRERLGVEVSGLAGLHVYFLLLAYEWLEQEGVAAWLIPSEWMAVNYGVAVRRFLCDNVSLERIHLFDATDMQFGDALVSSSVIFFRRGRPPVDATVRITSGGDLDDPRHEKSIPVASLDPDRKWAELVTGGTPANECGEANLGDFVDVKRGIVTGRNRWYIREREEWRSLGVSERFLRPILPSPRYLQTRTIESGRDGWPLLPGQLALLDCRLPPEQVREQEPQLWNVLSGDDAESLQSRRSARRNKPWYAQDRRMPAPLLVNYMGREKGRRSPFSFIWNSSDAIATNSYLMLYPKGALADHLAEHPEGARRAANVLEGIAGEHYRTLGRSYAGGLFKFEPREFASLPAGDFMRRIAG